LTQDRNDIDQILLRIKQVEEERQRVLRKRKRKQRKNFLIAAFIIVIVLAVVLVFLQRMGLVQGDIIASISTLIAALVAIYFSQLPVDNAST
jgi:uncharacterized Tic20 family protein